MQTKVTLKQQVLNALAKEEKIDNWKDWKEASVYFGVSECTYIERAVELALSAKQAEVEIKTLRRIKQLWEECDEAGEFGDGFFELLEKKGIV